MCCKSKGLSRLGVLWGLMALCTLLVAFVSGTWLYTKEPVTLPKSELTTSISFRIGLWRVCPSLKRINSSIHMPSPACSLVKYSGWDDVKASDLGVWAQLDLAPVFIARMRICTVLSGAAVGLLLFGFFFSLLGHCIGDNKTLIASGLYILGALLLGAGLMAFASVLSETVVEAMQYHHEMGAGGPAYDYRYGWCFFTAGAAFIMSKMAAVFSLSGYLNRFATVDEMVRVMVPGAERKLREHHRLAAEYMERHQRHRHMHHHHHHMGAPSRPQYDAMCTKEHHNKYEAECGPLLNKTPPDVCTTNKCIEFGGGGSSSDIDCTLMSAVQVGVEPNMVPMQPLGAALAGQTIPITIKNNHNVMPAPPSVSETQAHHHMYAGGGVNKYGTMPHPAHHQAFHGIAAAELGAASSSYTLQHQRGAACRKKCVKIETFHAPDASFSEFTAPPPSKSLAAGGGRSGTPSAAMNYSGSAV